MPNSRLEELRKRTTDYEDAQARVEELLGRIIDEFIADIEAGTTAEVCAAFTEFLLEADVSQALSVLRGVMDGLADNAARAAFNRRLHQQNAAGYTETYTRLCSVACPGLYPGPAA